MRSTAFASLLMGGLALAAGCGRQELAGPPAIRLAHDQCAECGMIINDERFACALLVERDNRREHVLFDDIGCMLDFEHKDAISTRVIDRFAHEYVSKAWVSPSDAAFLSCDPSMVPTPMGSGILAFADRSRATTQQGQLGGEIMDFTQLVAARQAWTDAHIGRPREGQ